MNFAKIFIGMNLVSVVVIIVDTNGNKARNALVTIHKDEHHNSMEDRWTMIILYHNVSMK